MHTARGTTIWYAPTDSLPTGIGADERLFIHNAVPIPSILFMFNLLAGFVVMGLVLRGFRQAHPGRPSRHLGLTTAVCQVLLALSWLD